MVVYAPGESYAVVAGQEQQNVTASPVGILDYTLPMESGAVTLTRGSAPPDTVHPIPSACWLTTIENEGGPWTLDMCIGFYTTIGDTLKGYVEFADGLYYVAPGGVSFGWPAVVEGDVYMRWVNVEEWGTEWLDARARLGVPADLYVYTLTRVGRRP